MTVDEVKKRVAYIEACKRDNEAAHSAEDEIHQDVLRAIAEGRCADPAACAAEALKSLDISFARWCA